MRLPFKLAITFQAGAMYVFPTPDMPSTTELTRSVKKSSKSLVTFIWSVVGRSVTLCATSRSSCNAPSIPRLRRYSGQDGCSSLRRQGLGCTILLFCSGRKGSRREQ